MLNSQLHLSVVIPVYHSAATLEAFLDKLMRVLNRTGRSYEIIFVDDGSPDDSWQVLAKLQTARPDRIVAIQLMRNFGQHNALMCGLRHAQGELVVTMDDDLQHPPEEIPRLLEAIETTRNDLVYGVPKRRRHRFWRNGGAAIIGVFYRMAFQSNVHPSPFRIMRKEVVDAILAYALNYTYIDGLLAWNTQRIGQVTVRHEIRANGRSGYSLGKLLVLALNLFTNFSLLPLQLVSFTGLLAALSGLIMGAYFLAKYFLKEIVVPGYASTIVAVLVLGGLQLLALGVMGEYVGRLHLNVNRKPQYTVRELLGPRGKHEVPNEEEREAPFVEEM